MIIRRKERPCKYEAHPKSICQVRLRVSKFLRTKVFPAPCKWGPKHKDYEQSKVKGEHPLLGINSIVSISLFFLICSMEVALHFELIQWSLFHCLS